MSKPLPHNATLLERRDLSESLARFRIEPDVRPPPGQRWFEPGQYISLGVNLEETEDEVSVQRAYSIASEPEEHRWLEFYIRRASPANTKFPLTHRLWALAPGDRLHASPRVVGVFTLERTLEPGDGRICVLVGSGTGIAPFVSMVRSAMVRGDRALLGRLVVMHGASHAHELGYREELEGAAGAGLRAYVPTVSRPKDSPDWTGDTGRVETHFAGEPLRALERRLGLPERGFSPQAAVAYVCGFTGTIVGVVSSLLARGFAPAEHKVRRQLEIPSQHPSSLFYEQYDPGSILDHGGPELIERLKDAYRRRSQADPRA